MTDNTSSPSTAFDSTNTWVLLWSQRQNAFHIEPLTRMLDSNRSAFADDRRSDYVVLELGSREAVDAAADGLRPICNARSVEKNEVRRLYSSDPEA